jgi:hypothetical protein
MIDIAVEHYVNTNMREVSQLHFRDWLTNTSDVKEALFNAVLNETINEILEQHIAEASATEAKATTKTSSYQQTVDKFDTEVWCNVQVEGTHNWPGCPFDEVAYLRDPHRHIFHIKAYKKVSHSDRDQEFIMLKHLIVEYLNFVYFAEYQKLCVFGAKSCEMIAEELIMQFDLSRCEVSEDDENGAVVNAFVGCAC